MNGTAFGFNNPTAQMPTPSPQAVGMMLMQKGQQQQQPAQAPAGASAIPAASQLMSAKQDETPIGGPDDPTIAALTAAARDAERRGAQGPGQQRSPAPQFNDQQLQNFGVSNAELRILKATGAIK
jgi:hypothetical protein